MFGTLLASRRFLPLFIVQFLSALNDNFVKNALAILILYRLGGQGPVSYTHLTLPTILRV